LSHLLPFATRGKQFYLARRAGWHENRPGGQVEVNVNGQPQPLVLDEQARARERRMAVIALMTINEKRWYLNLLDRLGRRQRGEDVVDVPSVLAITAGSGNGSRNG
jgi:hypothetical protein